jgi:FtsP/CotA-like multicopper oxidase with cupredoxin domain
VPLTSLLTALMISIWPGAIHDGPPVAVHNDNLDAAGALADGTLGVTLRIVETDWRPMGEDQPGAVVYAFSEGDGPPLVPGPLLRARLGTRMRVRVENPTDRSFVIQGLSSHQQPALDVVWLSPGETRVVEFDADAEGTYHYWAAIAEDAEHVPTLRERFASTAAVLGGAFVVDPAEGEISSDRIFLMNIYEHVWEPEKEDPGRGDLLVINGRPWPFTERIQANLGDTLDWRLINASERGHPMHLHGFFFQVTAKGDQAKDTLYWPSQRRMAVTEHMDPGSTVRFRWMPDRPGGWIFHCHLSFHVTPNPPLGDVEPSGEEFFTQLMLGDPHHDPDNHVEQGMGGLMMAVQVHAPEGWEPYDGPRRNMRLLIQSDSMPAPEGATHLTLVAPWRRQFAFVLQDGEREPAPDSVHLPGSTLVLRKDEPTSIWVVNRTDEPTSVHWHGLELDSYFDGVVGVGGIPTTPTPAVLPGDSFEVRITPPRAGSFMYHTHVNDIRQQSAGLYGPFVVLEEEREWDPDRDRVFITGLSPQEGGVFLNGSNGEMEPIELDQGETYRFRLMNITLASAGLRYRLVRNGDTTFWTPIAKDGFDLPAHQQVRTRSEQHMSIGETMDFAVMIPNAEGEYALEVRSNGGRLFARQPITVIPAPEGAGPGN